jgi:tRNA A-37 threonylcarbamoyl transferase component Bud32
MFGFISAESKKDVGQLEALYQSERPHHDRKRQNHKGVLVCYDINRTLQTAVIAACIELLQRMHAAGWVHGDTHLGNFMLDANTWRVVAIDVVR